MRYVIHASDKVLLYYPLNDETKVQDGWVETTRREP